MIDRIFEELGEEIDRKPLKELLEEGLDNINGVIGDVDKRNAHRNCF